MTVNGWIQILLFLALIFAVTKPLGVFMTRVFNRERTFLDPLATTGRALAVPRDRRR